MKLTSKQIHAVALLAEGSKCKAAAEAVGVSAQTLSDWRKNPEFEATLNSLKLDALEAARTRMQALALEAVETMAVLLKNAESPAVQLKAAQAVLDAVGMNLATMEAWAWGIGPTTADNVKLRNATDSQSPLLTNVALLGL